MSKFGWAADEVVAMASQCVGCSRKASNDSCDAYPQGIPMQILTNEHDHREEFPGDGGLLYEAVLEGAPHPVDLQPDSEAGNE